MKCIGLNTGPGIILHGARKFFDVVNSYQENSFGRDTCSSVYGLPTASCSEDYSRIPIHKVDCVFANAERWLDAQCAVKYVVANKIPILVLDVRAKFWGQYETLFNELATLAFPHGYRTTFLIYCCRSFDSGFSESRLAFVCHQKKHNFNISSPKLSKVSRNVYAYIGKIVQAGVSPIRPSEQDYVPENYYKLSYDEEVCLPKIPKGWTLKQVAETKFSQIPGTARDFIEKMLKEKSPVEIMRLQWNLKPLYSDMNNWKYIHPEAHRQLTIKEWMTLTDWKRMPVGAHPIEQIMYGTPLPAAEWLALQAKHWLRNKWKERDFTLTYNRKTQKFEGTDANPLRPKKFINIVDLYNSNYDTSDPVVFPKSVSVLDLDDDFVDY